MSELATGLVLMIDEDEINQKDWASIENLSGIVSEAYKLVATEFDAPEEVVVLLTSDRHVRDLNKDFRAKDKPTNVLSFPDEGADRLGDIAIAFETIKCEALESEISMEHHLSHLVIHGLLHLLGYDHILKSEAEQMEALEVSLLARLGIQNPYMGLSLVDEQV